MRWGWEEGCCCSGKECRFAVALRGSHRSLLKARGKRKTCGGDIWLGSSRPKSPK